VSRNTGPSPATRRSVLERDGSCIRCDVAEPLTLQHRRARGMGGTRRPESNQPAALIVLCGSGTTGCHGWTEAHPDQARALGYRVGQLENPADVPVLWHGVRVLLDDDGRVAPLVAAS
jgi:5-methylcytosine-specific restriction protein A